MVVLLLLLPLCLLLLGPTPPWLKARWLLVANVRNQLGKVVGDVVAERERIDADAN